MASTVTSVRPPNNVVEDGAAAAEVACGSRGFMYRDFDAGSAEPARAKPLARPERRRRPGNLKSREAAATTVQIRPLWGVILI